MSFVCFVIFGASPINRCGAWLAMKESVCVFFVLFVSVALCIVPSIAESSAKELDGLQEDPPDIVTIAGTSGTAKTEETGKTAENAGKGSTNELEDLPKLYIPHCKYCQRLLMQSSCRSKEKPDNTDEDEDQDQDQEQYIDFNSDESSGEGPSFKRSYMERYRAAKNTLDGTSGLHIFPDCPNSTAHKSDYSQPIKSSLMESPEWFGHWNNIRKNYHPSTLDSMISANKCGSIKEIDEQLHKNMPPIPENYKGEIEAMRMSYVSLKAEIEAMEDEFADKTALIEKEMELSKIPDPKTIGNKKKANEAAEEKKKLEDSIAEIKERKNALKRLIHKKIIEKKRQRHLLLEIQRSM
ncbi:uncharacterized protein NEMAJ01_2392, partial [Nematocida major]|uniref:uncharacterized protein n=1 Tax=Nematocida major TaxID=1912982 RepID=UPI00200849F5